MSEAAFSEQSIINNCPHCDRNSQAFADFLEESENFYTVCDAHPLREGHLLIIPKAHLSCVGEFSDEVFVEFRFLYEKAHTFVKENYGSVSTFEHGKIGQTVFHAHVHLLPFDGTPEQIVPEGAGLLQEVSSIDALRDVFARDGQYLFFSINNQSWIVDTKIGAPRFFRDRFAKVLGAEERGSWKEMHANPDLMAEAHKENSHCQVLWKQMFK